MTDITSITTALSSVKNAVNILQVIRDSHTSLEKAELNLKIADLTTALADVKMNLAEVQELIIDKNRQISDLKEKLKVQEKLEFKDEYYFLKSDDGEQGPFCQRCYDADGKFARLVPVKSDHGSYWCNVCNRHFGKPTSTPPGGDFEDDFY